MIEPTWNAQRSFNLPQTRTITPHQPHWLSQTEPTRRLRDHYARGEQRAARADLLPGPAWGQGVEASITKRCGVSLSTFWQKPCDTKVWKACYPVSSEGFTSTPQVVLLQGTRGTLLRHIAARALLALPLNGSQSLCAVASSGQADQRPH